MGQSLEHLILDSCWDWKDVSERRAKGSLPAKLLIQHEALHESVKASSEALFIVGLPSPLRVVFRGNSLKRRWSF